VENSKEKIDSFIKNAKNIVVTSHLSPDPDALGSALGVWFYVKNNFPEKKVKVVFEGLAAKQGSSLPGFSEIIWTANLSIELRDADLIFFVDGSLFSRFTNYQKEIDFQKFLTVCIDHHPEPIPDPFTLRICDTTAAAAAQLVADILFENDISIDQETAEVLLAAILGDTGNFRYIDPTKTRVFRSAERLVRLGKVNLQLLSAKLNSFELDAFDLVKILAKNSRRNFFSSKYSSVTYSFLPFSVLDQFSLPAIKDAYHYFQDSFIRIVSNTSWTFVVTPNDADFYNISFRSMPGGPNVQILAQKFGGGGHPLSSGGKYPTIENGEKVEAKDVCREVLEVFKKEKITLTSV
jgi:phosphoesterase RecJ-like protein